MEPKEVYRVVYETVRREADNPRWVSENHKKFAGNLPSPDSIDDYEAAVLSAMVVETPGDPWGLETFHQVPMEGGGDLADFVERNLPNYAEYISKDVMEPIGKKYT